MSAKWMAFPCDLIPADHVPTASGLCAACGRPQDGTNQGGHDE